MLIMLEKKIVYFQKAKKKIICKNMLRQKVKNQKKKKKISTISKCLRYMQNCKYE